MAQRGRFSGSAGYGGVPKQVIDQIRAQSTGENTSASSETVKPAGSSPMSGQDIRDMRMAAAARVPIPAGGIPARPDYSGMDFTGLQGKELKMAKRAAWSPEYASWRKSLSKGLKARREEWARPYTAEEIARDPVLRALKSGITFEQAVAAYRQQVKAMNAVPLYGQELTSAEQRKLNKLNASLTPVQKNAQRILGLLGGFGQFGASPSRGIGGETTQEAIFRRLGMATPTERGRVNDSYVIDPKFGPIISIANPLNKQQRSRLQSIRAIPANKRTAAQQQALTRLLGKKNAPVPYSEE